jgi:hypothetical protein
VQITFLPESYSRAGHGATWGHKAVIISKLFKLKLECQPQAQDRQYVAAEKSNKQALSARFTSEM